MAKLKYLIVLFSVATLASCASVDSGRSRLTAQRPADITCRTELKKEPSSVNIAIEASAAELSDALSSIVPKKLYKDATNANGLTAEIARNGRIGVNISDNYIYLTVPVAVSLSYGIFETPAIATDVKFKVKAQVTPDWRVHAELAYDGLSRQLPQELRVGPLSIKPRSIVEGVMQPMQRQISELIARKLDETSPLKAQVAQAWKAAQKPAVVDKKSGAWLRLLPQEVLLYPIYAQNNRLKVSVGLKCYAEVVVGPQPPAAPPVPLPNLKLVGGSDRTFRVALNTDLFYKEIVGITSARFLNKEVGTKEKSVILKGFDLSGNGDRVLVKVETSGSIDGTFYLTCRPAFDQQKNLFSVEDVDFDMQSKSLLLKSADLFLHDTIRNMVQEKLNLDLTKQLAEARLTASKAMAKVKLADKIFLAGNLKTLRVSDVMVQKDRISVQLYTEGDTAIVFH